MAMNKPTKILIAIVSVVILAGIAIGVIVKVVMDTKSHQIPQKCPDEVKKCNGTNELYHVTSGCVQKGKSDEICGDNTNMVITPAITCAAQGVCECDYENNDRHLVYDGSTDQCYFIYSQGPCGAREVVRPPLKAGQFRCERDDCVEKKSTVSSTERDSIVPYKKDCYALLSELDKPECTGQLQFWKNQEAPSCSPPATVRSGCMSCPISAASCPKGSKAHIQGHCTKSSEFTFSLDGNDDN